MIAVIDTLELSLSLAGVALFIGQVESLLAIVYLQPLRLGEVASFANDFDPRMVLLRILLLVAGAVAFFTWTPVMYASLFLVSVSILMVSFCGELGTLDTGEYSLNVYVLFASLVLLLPKNESAASVVLASGGAVWLGVYLISGSWKMSPLWLRGDALSRLLSTRTFGMPSLVRRLRGTLVIPIAQRLIPFVLVTIPFLILFGSREVALFGLALAGLFHISNAVVMGITSFFFAYLAFFPAVWHLRSIVRALV